MKKNVAVIAVVGVVCLFAITAFAECGMCQTGETKDKVAAVSTTTAPVKVNNTICPVMNDPVNMKNPVTVEYKGKIYNLCCSMCPATFKANPEKYSKIAEDQAKGSK